MQSEMFYDRKHAFLLEQVGEALAAGAGGAGGLGADVTPEGAPPADEAPTPEPAPAPTPDAEPGPLLATPGGPAPDAGGAEAPPPPPGKRDDLGNKLTTTASSKGKYYKPVQSDRRTGASQAFLSQGGQRYTGASTKSIFPGKDDVSSIYRMSEQQAPNYYDEQEQELLRERKEVKDLIDSLNKLETTKDEVEA
jgi:hypothetical protein